MILPDVITPRLGSLREGGPIRPMSRRCLGTAAGSFMARVKAANDPSVLLGPFTSAGRFDACLERAGMECLALSLIHI